MNEQLSSASFFHLLFVIKVANLKTATHSKWKSPSYELLSIFFFCHFVYTAELVYIPVYQSGTPKR